MAYISKNNFATLCGVSNKTIEAWINHGKVKCCTDKQEFLDINNLYHKGFSEIDAMVDSQWDKDFKIKPKRAFTSIELFAGAGGLALGFEKAGFRHVMLNELNKYACQTLNANRPQWHVINDDIHNISFQNYKGQVDLISGGFPCQAFSYAGNKGGFEDARGTLFFELARAVKEVKPKVFIGENVKGLLSHDNGKTLSVIKNTIAELGYTLIEPRVLKAVMYQVPQKRERLFLVAIRNDLVDKAKFKWPDPFYRVCTLKDAFYKGILFDQDVPESQGQLYPEKKRQVMELVPMGGNWKDLPLEVQKQYMKGCFYLEGGKTGLARRLHIDEPSLTLTCAPAMKQTERCHPLETRPLNIREYARIQTFPDDWVFKGSLSEQYKQIGNAVPVNLSYAVGRSLIRLLNGLVE